MIHAKNVIEFPYQFTKKSIGNIKLHIFRYLESKRVHQFYRQTFESTLKERQQNAVKAGDMEKIFEKPQTFSSLI